MTQEVRRVGVIGLGAMGMGVAQLLLRAGWTPELPATRMSAIRSGELDGEPR